MRYQKQEIFLGKDLQKKIEKSKIAVVGLGALGSVVADQLVRAGVKELILIDRDFVEESNLQRQTLYNEEDLLKTKADAAKKRLQKINRKTRIKSFAVNLDFKNVFMLDKVDLVIDCTDNLETRFLINEYCKKKKLPWIYGAVAGGRGFVYNTLNEACFNCIFRNSIGAATCSSEGIISPASNIVASIQVMEAFKILNGNGTKDLIHIDAWNNRIELIKVKKDVNCNVCKGVYEILEGKKSEKEYEIRMCDTRSIYSIKFKNEINYDKIKKKFDVKIESPVALAINVLGHEVLVYKYGEVFVRNCNDASVVRKIAAKIGSI